jgi:hypothetical protein
MLRRTNWSGSGSSSHTASIETPAEGLNRQPDKCDRRVAAGGLQRPQLPRPLNGSLKDASITIRMSKAECAQLHRRAAEAGLTVSAYLRSCTFEAESLRAMVKDTMAQLRSASAQIESRACPGFLVAQAGQWMARLVNPWQESQTRGARLSAPTFSVDP